MAQKYRKISQTQCGMIFPYFKETCLKGVLDFSSLLRALIYIKYVVIFFIFLTFVERHTILPVVDKNYCWICITDDIVFLDPPVVTLLSYHRSISVSYKHALIEKTALTILLKAESCRIPPFLPISFILVFTSSQKLSHRHSRQEIASWFQCHIWTCYVVEAARQCDEVNCLHAMVCQPSDTV